MKCPECGQPMTSESDGRTIEYYCRNCGHFEQTDDPTWLNDPNALASDDKFMIRK